MNSDRLTISERADLESFPAACDIARRLGVTLEIMPGNRRYRINGATFVSGVASLIDAVKAAGRKQ